MADIKVESAVKTAQDSLDPAPDALTFTGASSTWAAQHTLGGATNDDLVFDPPIRGVRVGVAGGGALKVQYVSGRIDTMATLTASNLPVLGKIRRVYAVGTTIEAPTFIW